MNLGKLITVRDPNNHHLISVCFDVGLLFAHRCRYGGFSLGAKSSQAVDEPHHLEESVLAIRRRYNIVEV